MRKRLNMNDREQNSKVHSAMYHQCLRQGCASLVDVLIEIGVLTKEKYEGWRFGRVDYLERDMQRQSPQALVHYPPDASICAEKRHRAFCNRV